MLIKTNSSASYVIAIYNFFYFIIIFSAIFLNSNFSFGVINAWSNAKSEIKCFKYAFKNVFHFKSSKWGLYSPIS